MKQNMLGRTLGLCVALSIVASAYGQGIYWESTASGSMMQGKTMTSKFYYMPKMFKTVTREDGEAVMFRLDKEMMIMVNPKEKTYSEMTFAEMEKSMKQVSPKMDQAMAEMQKQMENMPEEQRKMVEKMMGEKMPGKKKEGKVEVVNTGEKKTISGYSCTKFVIKEDGKEVAAVWATKDVKDFEAMRRDMEQFSKRMAAMNPMMGKGTAEGIKSVEGFPIETDMGESMKEVVTKIEKRSIAASEFEVPAGYKKVKSPLFGGKEEQE